MVFFMVIHHQQATDLVPVQKDLNIPENLQFRMEDAGRGLNFPDGYFDLFHGRMLLVGVSV